MIKVLVQEISKTKNFWPSKTKLSSGWPPEEKLHAKIVTVAVNTVLNLATYVMQSILSMLDLDRGKNILLWCDPHRFKRYSVKGGAGSLDNDSWLFSQILMLWVCIPNRRPTQRLVVESSRITYGFRKFYITSTILFIQAQSLFLIYRSSLSLFCCF